MIRWRIVIVGWIGIWMGFIHAGFSQVRTTEIDSTYWQLSLPELQNHKAYYMLELQALQEEKRNLIQRGIEDGERLLEMKPNIQVVDKILIRLADLYYYQEKDEYISQMELFDRLLEQELIEDLPEEPRLEYERSMQLYQRIIDEFPNSELVDDAVYNKGFLFEEMGENQKSNQIYQHLIRAYPESRYVPEAHMRLGEYSFNPPVNDIHGAIGFYEKVLQYRDNPRYDEALYKLGWSYYRLSEYPAAISYFTTLVEGSHAIEQIDELALSVRADLREEAVEYIAISFIDFGGPFKLREYLQGIGEPEWGWDALKKLGDIYMQEKEEYVDAIAAYQTLLAYAPNAPEAPLIQRKIVDCYHVLNDETQAFNFRQELFLTYKTDGNWWNEMTDDTAKLLAYKLAEQALRENINSLIKRAEELSSDALYQEAVDQGKMYLETFPEELHAYMIRWNMALILDTKLNSYKEALQEYLTICMVYHNKEYETFAREKGLSSLKDAAENAIVVADSVVQRDWRSANDDQSAQQGNGAEEPQPLTAAESWLAMAYDNYIKLFPYDKNTPRVLANAGALYYTHNQFTESVKYFKTLTKYFPESNQVQYAKNKILESYFGKKDYESAELMAKNLMEESDSETSKKAMEKRLGEAIFLKAQARADGGQTSQAADEFYRMALEVPTLEFADRALFNSGRAYEEVSDFKSAIRAYELLRVSYSGSSYLQDALNNLAFDYGEIGDYQTAAERYETLAGLKKEGEGARDATYNAFIFYGKSENWLKAIDIGITYVSRYPDEDDAPSVYFQTGEYYRKLNDDEGIKRVYSRFAQRFPDSPLGVMAFYELGKFYFETDSLESAEKTFYRAYTTSEALKARALESNSYFAAEGLFLASQLLDDRYRKISFFLPQHTLNRQITQKQSLLQQLVDQYTKVVAFRTQHLPESVYRIGSVYENFAQTWAAQEIPFMNPTSRVIKEKEINERTTQIYDQALAAYRRAIQVLDRVLDNTDFSDQESDSTQASVSDTLNSLTKFWFERSNEKVSETIYQMAEVNAQSIERLLTAPIPADLNDLAQFEYRNQVLIKAIKPLLDVVVQTHLRNLQVADSLGLENTWIEASGSKMVSSLTLLGKKYDELACDVLSTYERITRSFRNIALESKNRASDEMVNTIVNLIELSKTYSQAALIFYKRGILDAAGSGIPFSNLHESHSEMVRFVLRSADVLDDLIAKGFVDQQAAEKLFVEAGDIQYEEALAVFEDNVFFLEQNLKVLLEDAYEIEKSFPVASPWGEWIGIRLVKMDPATYSKKLNIPIVSLTVVTDTTWWFSPLFQEGWELPNVKMIGWYHPHMQMGSELSWKVSRAPLDTSLSRITRDRQFYIRKEILVPGFPISGEIAFDTVQPVQVFLNGLAVSHDSGGSPLSIVKVLREGTNLVALKCPLPGTRSMDGRIQIQFIPERVLPQRLEDY